MALEVLNPKQLFRDDRGRPLAGGRLKILQPGTSMLGTAFSDDALTVPQTVDPYVLDQYGRTNADLKWSGTRDIEVRDANDAFVRTLPDVVTAIDPTVFAVNAPSVAAMVANTALEVGDVVETQSYNAGQGQGGARYLIVPNGTGTAEGYRFHDLTNGLQAQLIDQERNNNFYVAGARGDGASDDSTPVQRLLNVGGDIRCENGTFAVASLTLTQNARIAGNGTLLRFAFAGADIIALSGADLEITFDGIVMDGNLANQAAALQIALVRSTITATASQRSLVTFNNVTFRDPSQNSVAGRSDDSGNQVLYSLAQCTFLGGEEGTDAFPVADVLMEDGADCNVDDCYFNLEASPSDPGGRPSVVAQSSGGGQLTNRGRLSVTSSTFVQTGMALGSVAATRAAIHAREVRNLIVAANRLLTPHGGGILWGAEVNVVSVTGNTITGLTGTNIRAAIAAISTTATAAGNDWQVDNNTVSSVGGVAIQLDGTSAGANAARAMVLDNIVQAPTLQAVLIGALEDVSIEGNYINMDNAANQNAVQFLADTVGIINVIGNEIAKVAGTGTAIINGVANTAAGFFVDGNVLDSVNDGIAMENVFTAIITNNVMATVSGRLIVVGIAGDVLIEGNSSLGSAPATFAQNTGGLSILVVGENFWQQTDNSIRQIAVTGANITAGPITSHYHEMVPTGATTIDSLTDPGIDGFVVVLQSTGAANVTFNNAAGNLRLGAATRVLGDNEDTLTLAWNQTNSFWAEVAFSNN